MGSFIDDVKGWFSKEDSTIHEDIANLKTAVTKLVEQVFGEAETAVTPVDPAPSLTLTPPEETPPVTNS